MCGTLPLNAKDKVISWDYIMWSWGYQSIAWSQDTLNPERCA